MFHGGATSARRSFAVLVASFFLWLVPLIGTSVSLADVAHTIVVDPSDPDAADGNPGSAQEPVQTIGRALELAREYNTRSVPVIVLIHPGTYREGLALNADSQTTSAPITLQGTGEGVTVSGSEVWTGWAAAGEGIFTHPWKGGWGLAPLPEGWEGQASYLEAHPVIRRREMVFVDGRALRQVMSSSQLQATTDSFFVSDDEGMISLHVPADRDLRTSQVEVATRPYLLQIGSRQNIAIQDVDFVHAATPMPGAAVSIAESDHVMVEGSDFQWNSWNGLGMFHDGDVEIRDVRADHNGVGGITGSGIHDLLVVDTQTSNNNWRGSSGWDPRDHSSAIDPNFIDFATGQKFFALRDARFSHFRSVANLSGGLWFDYDDSRITLDHVVLSGNLTHGLMVEASQGPISVTNSEICGNESGILSNNAANVHVTGSVLAGNILGQVFIAGANGPRDVVDSDTGATLAVQAEDWMLQGNDVVVDTGQLALGTYLSGDLWSAFIGTLHADNNRYISRSETAIFGVPGKKLDLDQWKAETGVDRASTFSRGSVDCRVSATSLGSSSAAPSPNGPPTPSPAGQDGSVGGKGGWFIAGAILVFACLLAAVVVRRRLRSASAR